MAEITVTIEPGTVPAFEEEEEVTIRAVVTGGAPGMLLLLEVVMEGDEEFACKITGSHVAALSKTEGTPDRHEAIWAVKAYEAGAPDEIRVSARGGEFPPAVIKPEGVPPDEVQIFARPTAVASARPAGVATVPQVRAVAGAGIVMPSTASDPMPIAVGPTPRDSDSDLPVVDPDEDDPDESSSAGIVIDADDKKAVQAYNAEVVAVGKQVRKDLDEADDTKQVRQPRRKSDPPEDPNKTRARFEHIESGTAAFARGPRGLVPAGEAPQAKPAVAEPRPTGPIQPAVPLQVPRPAAKPQTVEPEPQSVDGEWFQEKKPFSPTRRWLTALAFIGVVVVSALLVMSVGGIGFGTLIAVSGITSDPEPVAVAPRVTVEGPGMIAPGTPPAPEPKVEPEPIPEPDAIAEVPEPEPVAEAPEPEPEPVAEAPEPEPEPEPVVKVEPVPQPEADPPPAETPPPCQPLLSATGWQMRDMSSGKLILQCGDEYRLADVDCSAGKDKCVVRPGKSVNLK